jgi:Tfp pilus assembly protein PilO
MPLPGDEAMKFSKLPKEKRNHLVLVGLVTLAVMGGLGFGLIKHQYGNLSGLANKQADAEQKLKQMQEGIKHAARLEAELLEAKAKLAAQEAGIASGPDVYAWAIRTIGDFKARYKDKVDIPRINPSGPVGSVNLLPRFPYKQATFSVAGTAYYHDLGQFLADLENAHPLIRLVNLDLDLAGGQTAKEREKLSFRVDIVTLVNPNPS